MIPRSKDGAAPASIQTASYTYLENWMSRRETTPLRSRCMNSACGRMWSASRRRRPPDHGVGITRRIQQIIRGTFDVKPGSLFPALHRLEERGWLASQWGESENRRRAKYYMLTAVGRREVDAELTNWPRIVTAIGWAIKATS